MSTTDADSYSDPLGLGAAQISEQYRKFLNDTSWYTHTNEHNAPELMYLTLGLAGESGEFADAVKKIIRVSGTHDDASFAELMQVDGGEEKLLEELGDVLWYLTKLADFLGVSINDLMVRNTYKLYTRLIERGQFTAENMPWPFSHSRYSYYNVQRELFPLEGEK